MADQSLQIPSIRLHHPGVMELAVAGLFHPSRPEVIETLDVNARVKKLAEAFAPYLQPLLLGFGLGELDTAGAFRLSAQVERGKLRSAHLRVNNVRAKDGQGRFQLAGLKGALAFNAGAEPKPSRLRWRKAEIYRLPLGAGDLRLSSSEGHIHMTEDARVAMLDGQLRVGALRVLDLGGERPALELNAELTPVSLPDFSRAMGWLPLSGTLSGRLPALRFTGEVLELGGALTLNVFDGRLIARRLVVQDLFGPVPAMRADIEIDNLNLETLTDTFSFGRIEGRLGGEINQLQLEDWQPVYFEAKLATPPDDSSRHRISQRAIDNLTSIGGGMTVGAVSRTFLREFEDFRYDRLGIQCRLHRGVCEMDGIEPADGGYYIVKRGLLPPWIDVKGFNRAVDWEVLLERLKSVQDSEGPVIE
jgi:hypothetical protein